MKLTELTLSAWQKNAEGPHGDQVIQTILKIHDERILTLISGYRDLKSSFKEMKAFLMKRTTANGLLLIENAGLKIENTRMREALIVFRNWMNDPLNDKKNELVRISRTVMEVELEKALAESSSDE